MFGNAHGELRLTVFRVRKNAGIQLAGLIIVFNGYRRICGTGVPRRNPYTDLIKNYTFLNPGLPFLARHSLTSFTIPSGLSS